MQGSQLKISRVLHAGFIFENGTTKIMFDPILSSIFSYNCYAFPAVEFKLEKTDFSDISAIFISHFHEDHFCLKSLSYLSRDIPIYMYSQDEIYFSFLRKMGFKNIISLELNKNYKIGSLQISTIEALDRDTDCVFKISDGLHNILNVVDSWLSFATVEKLQKQCQWDLVIWPFQPMRETEIISPFRMKNYNTEFPAEWIDQIKLLNPRFVIPGACQFKNEEWSWYNSSLFPLTYRKFNDIIVDNVNGASVKRLDPGQSFILENGKITDTAALSWLSLNAPVNSQDYDFKPELNVPSLQEICKYLKKINDDEIKIINSYLNSDIFNIWTDSVAGVENSFFESNRNWRLTIYFSSDDFEDFDFIVNRNDILKSNFKSDEVDWWSEICAAKLISALNEGESLTSLHYRINDRPVSQKAEEDLKIDFNIFDDPLLHLLYGRSKSSFHEIQLAHVMQKSVNNTQ